MTQVATQKKQSLANFLNSSAVSKMLSETIKENKSSFVSNLIAMTSSDVKLQECDPAELMQCALNATALNLPLNKNLGYAYIIPYKGKPSFQVGYKGIIQLALRTGQYKYINAIEVREGEISRNKFTGEIKFIGDFPQNKIVGHVALLKLNNGFEASFYMTNDQIEDHALRYSQTYKNDKKYGSKSSKWSDLDERPKMANKTVLKALLGTYGMLSVEMMKAFDMDSEETIDTAFEEVTIKEVKIQNDPEIINQTENQETFEL